MPSPARLATGAAVLLLLGGCASVNPDAAFSNLRQLASDRLGGREMPWNRGTAEDKAAQETVARLLENPLTVDRAVRIALINNKHLQAEYEELGVAQAELVQAGLLENPSFSAEILVGNGAVNLSFSVVQDFVQVLTLSARRAASNRSSTRRNGCRTAC